MGECSPRALGLRGSVRGSSFSVSSDQGAVARSRRRGSAKAFAEGELRKAPRSVPDRKSTRLNSSHVEMSYAGFCLKKKRVPLDNPEHFGPARPEPSQSSPNQPTHRGETGPRPPP